MASNGEINLFAEILKSIPVDMALSDVICNVGNLCQIKLE